MRRWFQAGGLLRRWLQIVVMVMLIALCFVVGWTGSEYYVATLRTEMELQIATRAMIIEMLDRGKSDAEIWARIEAMDNGLDQQGRTVEEIKRFVEAMRKEYEK